MGQASRRSIRECNGRDPRRDWSAAWGQIGRGYSVTSQSAARGRAVNEPRLGYRLNNGSDRYGLYIYSIY